MPDFQALQTTSTVHKTALLSAGAACKVSLRRYNTPHYLIYL